MLPSLGEAKEGEGRVTKPTELGPLERASLNQWRLALSKRLKTGHVFSFFRFFRILDDG